MKSFFFCTEVVRSQTKNCYFHDKKKYKQTNLQKKITNLYTYILQNKYYYTFTKNKFNRPMNIVYRKNIKKAFVRFFEMKQKLARYTIFQK